MWAKVDQPGTRHQLLHLQVQGWNTAHWITAFPVAVDGNSILGYTSLLDPACGDQLTHVYFIYSSLVLARPLDQMGPA